MREYASVRACVRACVRAFLLPGMTTAALAAGQAYIVDTLDLG